MVNLGFEDLQFDQTEKNVSFIHNKKNDCVCTDDKLEATTLQKSKNTVVHHLSKATVVDLWHKNLKGSCQNYCSMTGHQLFLPQKTCKLQFCYYELKTKSLHNPYTVTILNYTIFVVSKCMKKSNTTLNWSIKSFYIFI